MQQQAVQREHLKDRLVLAELLGGEDDALAERDGAQTGDRELAADDQHDHPGRHARLARHGGQHDQRRHDDQLVGQRIEQLAQRAW